MEMARGLWVAAQQIDKRKAAYQRSKTSGATPSCVIHIAAAGKAA